MPTCRRCTGRPARSARTPVTMPRPWWTGVLQFIVQGTLPPSGLRGQQRHPDVSSESVQAVPNRSNPARPPINVHHRLRPPAKPAARRGRLHEVRTMRRRADGEHRTEHHRTMGTKVRLYRPHRTRQPGGLQHNTASSIDPDRLDVNVEPQGPTVSTTLTNAKLGLDLKLPSAVLPSARSPSTMPVGHDDVLPIDERAASVRARIAGHRYRRMLDQHFNRRRRGISSGAVQQGHEHQHQQTTKRRNDGCPASAGHSGRFHDNGWNREDFVWNVVHATCGKRAARSDPHPNSAQRTLVQRVCAACTLFDCTDVHFRGRVDAVACETQRPIAM